MGGRQKKKVSHPKRMLTLVFYMETCTLPFGTLCINCGVILGIIFSCVHTVGAESVYRAKSLYSFSAAAVFTPYH